MKKRMMALLCALCMLAGLAPALAEEAPLTEAPLAEAPLTAESADKQEAPLQVLTPGEAPVPALETADRPRGADEGVTSFNGLTSAIGSGGTIELDGNITMDAAIEISNTVILDLKGYTLTAKEGARHFAVKSGGSLTVKDSSGPGAGKLYGNNAGGGVSVEEGGTFILKNGTITGCKTDDYGGGVYVYTGANFNMTAGSIIACKATRGNGGGVYVGGEFTMSGTASIKNCEAYFGGGGVYMLGDTSIFTMSDQALITDCAVTIGSGGGPGGGVYVYSGIFTMKDSCSVKGCTATNDGGGVYVLYKGAFKMQDGCSVQNCTADGDGGGVQVKGENSAFTLSGTASIQNCEAANGGGVCVSADDEENSTFTMTGGSIAGCKSTNGGGVYVSGEDDAQSTFTMTGGAITGCTAQAVGGGVCVSGEDKANSIFTMSGGAIEGCKADTGGGVYVNSRDTAQSAFAMSGTASVTNCAATAKGGSHDSGEYGGGGVFVMGESSAFTMEGGASVTGCTAQAVGGGVYMLGDKSTFTMSGNASVAGCKADLAGGVGVLEGTFAMSDNASVTGCQALALGGGVVSQKGITLGGAPKITGNQALGILYDALSADGEGEAPFPNNVVLVKTDPMEFTAIRLAPEGLAQGAAIGVWLMPYVDYNSLAAEVVTGWAEEAVLMDADGNALSKEHLGGYFTVDDRAQGTDENYGTIISGKLEGGLFKTGKVEPDNPPTPIVQDTALALDKTVLELAPGETAKLKASLTPADATYKYIFWTSSDEAVAAVSDSGLVTAVAEGAATITAKSWYGNEATCEVTVKKADVPTPPDEPDRPDPWPTEGLAGFVTRCYRVALSREPDKAGHADWVRWLKDGTVDATSCTYGFVFSKEMNNKKLSDEAFVETLYRLFMDREGEATGITFWTNYLKDGHSREEAFHGFADSVEFVRLKASYGIR